MSIGRSEILERSRKARRTAANLTAREWRCLLRAWLMLFRTALAMRLRPSLRDSERLLPSREARIPDNAAVWELIGRFERGVRIASYGFPRRIRCLGRSLALGRLLLERGVSTTLKIGVRRPDGRLEAHAWLEFAGRPIGDPEDIGREYAPLAPGKPMS